MLVAVGAFLAKVAVVTVVAVAAAALAVAGLASNAQSAKNVRDGARDMLDGSRQKVYDDVVDDWNEKDGFWQRPDANERLSGKVFARSAAGGARVAYEATKAGVLVAAPVGSDGFSLAEKAVTIQEFAASRTAPPTAQSAGQPESPAVGDESWVCEDGVEWGCDIQVQPGEPTPDRDETNEPSADGVYSLDRRPLIASIPADASSADGQITIDADADLPIRGAVSITSTPHTGGVSQTIVYEFWSEDAPAWDEGSSSWDVSLYLQRTYDEPYLFSATIRGGVLSSQYPPYGLAFTFVRQPS